MVPAAVGEGVDLSDTVDVVGVCVEVVEGVLVEYVQKDSEADDEADGEAEDFDEGLSEVEAEVADSEFEVVF